ncbi:glutathione synthase [Hypoxylon sp. FL1284]|nr:glutathione synthase [Hypoxylon sp. FL1284]
MEEDNTLDDGRVERILSELEDYQISHGSLLKFPRRADFDSQIAEAQPIGVSIIPTGFPRSRFEQAQRIQTIYNELYVKVAEDDAWLETVIRPLTRADDFVAKLWSIWESVRDEGEVQQLRCGIFRSDYMLHHDLAGNMVHHCELAHIMGRDLKLDLRRSLINPGLKQVEFNTYSCAGAAHATIVADMHRYLARKGYHGAVDIPSNNGLKSITELLAEAHKEYLPTDGTRQTAILMTVQPNNVNICDERPTEYALSECDPPIILYRVEFSGEVMRCCSLGPNRELLFQPPEVTKPFEISVVYQRAGYEPQEYGSQGIRARLMLERSRAIKCPSILSHISGLKKVQQELTRPGTLEKYLEPENAFLLRQTFMTQYPMDESEDGRKALQLALDERICENYILKPSLEGGGHNVFGEDIPDFLESITPQERSKFILMRKIDPPESYGALVSPTRVFQGPVVSELGILGLCLWRRNGQGHEKAEIMKNSRGGWTFKTKPYGVAEMSVVKGYGCFDCPFLF